MQPVLLGRQQPEVPSLFTSASLADDRIAGPTRPLVRTSASEDAR
jgi:hypothetical protein